MKDIIIERKTSLRNIIKNLGIGLYSTKIEDVNSVFIVSEKYPQIIIKPVEYEVPNNVLIRILDVAVTIFKKIGINLKRIERNGLSYQVYTVMDDTLVTENLLEMICYPESSETYSLEDEVWDMYINVSDDYEPVIDSQVENMDLPIELGDENPSMTVEFKKWIYDEDINRN